MVAAKPLGVACTHFSSDRFRTDPSASTRVLVTYQLYARDEHRFCSCAVPQVTRPSTASLDDEQADPSTNDTVSNRSPFAAAPAD
jgi:hypothetical protein